MLGSRVEMLRWQHNVRHREPIDYPVGIGHLRSYVSADRWRLDTLIRAARSRQDFLNPCQLDATTGPQVTHGRVAHVMKLRVLASMRPEYEARSVSRRRIEMAQS